ncbi:ATP-binding cassette domain-containing protein [[Ruminococcus] torques]|uniref:ATP-binding cassette domain-containing protein n=1 Tax=[Ruminococcus] torques TaxID=33039 RepID=UPI003FED8913
MNKIQIKNITKKYNNLTALDDVSFSFEFGKIYGLLGRNGAGKSTLINIIANRIFADEGMILVDDIPAKENMQVHEKVFCMSEADLYDKDLKIKEHFRWINRFYDCFDLNKALTIAKMFDLDINKKFRSLSKGYQSIFNLINLIIHFDIHLSFIFSFYSTDSCHLRTVFSGHRAPGLKLTNREDRTNPTRVRSAGGARPAIVVHNSEMSRRNDVSEPESRTV